MTTSDGIPHLPLDRRRIGTWTVFLVAIALLLVMLALAFGVGLFLSGRQVDAELARIRVAGEPITAADLEAFYSLPPNTPDATELWMAATKVVSQEDYRHDADPLPLMGKSAENLPEVGDPWPKQAEIERFLAKYADVLAKLHEAAAMGGAARYPTDYANSASGAIPQAKVLIRCAGMLALEAEVCARHDDSHAATKSVHTMLAIGRSLEAEPNLFSLHLWLVSDRMAIAAFERVLQRCKLSNDDLTLIDGDLAHIDYRTAFHRSILGERVIGMQVYGHPAVTAGKPPKRGRWTVFRHSDFAVYLQMMGELVSASNTEDLPSMRTAIEQADRKINAVATATGARWRYPLASHFRVNFKSLSDHVCRGTARRDVARMAIAVERFRRSNGVWPKSLDDLVPDVAKQVPIDPFSGAPIRMIAAENECRIYSVGPDGLDQGGTADEAGSAGDIVFRLTNRATVNGTNADD